MDRAFTQNGFRRSTGFAATKDLRRCSFTTSLNERPVQQVSDTSLRYTSSSRVRVIRIHLDASCDDSRAAHDSGPSSNRTSAESSGRDAARVQHCATRLLFSKYHIDPFEKEFQLCARELPHTLRKKILVYRHNLRNVRHGVLWQSRKAGGKGDIPRRVRAAETNSFLRFPTRRTLDPWHRLHLLARAARGTP